MMGQKAKSGKQMHSAESVYKSCAGIMKDEGETKLKQFDLGFLEPDSLVNPDRSVWIIIIIHITKNVQETSTEDW